MKFEIIHEELFAVLELKKCQTKNIIKSKTNPLREDF